MRALVVGVGQPHRGDDAAGLEVARLVGVEDVPALEVRYCTGDAASLIEQWKGADRVILVDAVVGSGRPPGTVCRFDGRSGLPPSVASSPSTHGFGVEDALTLAQALGSLPPEVTVYGIEAESFAVGTPLSPSVRAGVREAAARVLAEVHGKERQGPARESKLR